MPRAQIIDRDPGRPPLFYRDLRDVGFFFKDFIYLFERERQTVSKKGNPSRGVGEEEAGSQRRSLMRDSFPECCDHALIQRQALNDCATQVPWVVGFLIFQPAFWGEGTAVLIFRQPCLGRVALSPTRRDGDGHNVSRYFRAFVLWWLSLVVFCASSESQSSSGCILASVSEQRDHSPLSPELSWSL